ncbi:serine hydrolase domain-containing protein [Niabella sp. 22666]|uniref:serine hydrolase domain-containing protein n=1 Tax=Niabella sp. 22666 TaxID=3453954 RepID=UPI003F851063
MKKPLLACFTLLLYITLNAQQSLEQRLDSLMNASVKPEQPGCALLVSKGGSILYNKAFGKASTELDVPLKPDMVFKIASITKQFSAVAILQLVAQGKISLADSIQQYIPDFPVKSGTIRIQHLLTHTSGIPDYMQLDFKTPYLERRDFKPAQLIDSFKTFPLEFQPGTQYRYSNSGYYLLGYIIEKVTGKSYQAYIHDRLLKPLGLRHTYFDSTGTIIPNRVNGYRREGTVYKNADFWSPTIAYAAGGLFSTTEDLHQWMQGLLGFGILPKEYLDKAWTANILAGGVKTSYGYGWQVNEVNGLRSVEHGGHMNGFTSNLVYYPDEKVTISLLFNDEDAPRDNLSRLVSEIVLGKSSTSAVKAVSQYILDSYIGVYALTGDKNRTINVSKGRNGLIARVSGQEELDILFSSPTQFQLKNIKDATGEFKLKDGKVISMIIKQNGVFEWQKIR